jgi:3-phenylpropionate/trans-cinnamate dioxygenase ferredoxin reductase subunit
MTNLSSYVIVGASLAGAKAAEALRAEGFEGRIVLIGDEDDRPYERPALSKGYLLGTEDRAKAYVHEESWYADHEVDLLLGRRVVRIDRSGHEVELDGGSRVGYTKLLLATGASPRRLGLPGADLDGIRYLRRVGDADALREAVGGGGHVVVVGAGWIGLETAAAAREFGCQVTVVEPQPTPLAAALGTEVGSFFAGLHRRQGVDLRLGRSVTKFVGTRRVAGVVLDDGRQLAADTVIVGIGARPNSELAEEAGLTCEDGIVVDASLRTEDPAVFAAGDVARSYHPFYGRPLRVEHWDNALNGGTVAAKAMLGQSVVHDRLPYFFTDQYDIGMEYCGWTGPGGYDQVVVRGDADEQAFYAFWLGENKVLAGMHVNRWDDGIDPVRVLIRSGQQVDPVRLADPSVPLTADEHAAGYVTAID